MADFVAKSILTAAALNAKFNSFGYRGDITTISARFGGGNAGITGAFTGKFIAVLNAICTVQIQLSFTSIGSSVGDFTLDLDGTNFFTSGTFISQRIDVVNVQAMSGARYPRDTPLYGIIQAKQIRLLASQYSGTTGRVLNNTDFTNASYLELAGTYITY